MHSRILITGGAGFIGSRLVHALLQDQPDCKIWILDNLHPQVHGDHPVLPVYPEQVELLVGDIADKGVVRELVTKVQPELIYHLAAETGTGQSYDEVIRYCNVNVTGTANLIEAVRSLPVIHPIKIVLSASRAVYGEGAYSDADGRIYVGLPREAENMADGDFAVYLPPEAQQPFKPEASFAGLPPAPASVYASTKLMQEYLLQQTCETGNVSSLILRFQNVYGPGQSLRNPYTGVLSIFSRQLMEGKTLAIYEDGLIARDFVFVDDVVDAMVKAGQSNLPNGTSMDIGAGRAVSILDAARLLIRYLDCPDNRFSVTGQFRVGDIRHACADICTARSLLGWEPQVSIETGLSKLAVWAREQFKSNLL